MKARNWSAEDLQLLRERYGSCLTRDIAAELRRSYTSVRSKAKALKLRTGRRPFTAAELQTVRDLYPDQRAGEIAKRLGRSMCSIHGIARKLGVEKSEAFRNGPESGILRKGQTRPESIPYQFQKGQVPANKGLRRPGWSPGRMKETQFKKGGRPHNQRPVGTILTDADGYLRIKVRERRQGDKQGWDPNVWPPLHIRTWERTHGSVPPEHVVVFKDGNRQDCGIENLECIPRAELANRNRMWGRYPAELAQAIQLQGVLKRKLRRLSDGEEQDVRSA